MKRLDLLKYFIPIILAAILLVTCNRNFSKPGMEYMPDMAHSKAYETYTKVENEAFPTGETALKPVKGTIPVGHTVYDLPNTPEGYLESAFRMTNPIATTDASLERGKQIYTIHCTPCHGTTGNGEGSAVVGSDYKLGAPSVKFDAPQPDYLTPGRMFHTITYGSQNGLMGSYASQVSTEDRWKVIQYIKTLDKTAKEAPAEEPAADSGE